LLVKVRLRVQKVGVHQAREEHPNQHLRLQRVVVPQPLGELHLRRRERGHRLQRELLGLGHIGDLGQARLQIRQVGHPRVVSHDREGERRAVARGIGCPVAGVRVWLRTVALRARLQVRLKLRVELAHIVPQPRVVRQLARAEPIGERARHRRRLLQVACNPCH
jgi:hypothetical protein